MDSYLSLLHWAFFAAALFIATVTEFLKKFFKLLPQNKWVKLFTPTRLMPAILGALLGLIPGIPCPDIVGGDDAGIGHVLYFATAGILSAWLYSLFQKLFEDILPGELKEFITTRLGTTGHSDKEEE